MLFEKRLSSKKKNLSLLSEIFLFFIFIAIFLLAVSLLTNQYYLNFFKEIIEERTLISLNILGGQVDDILQESYNQACDFIWNSRLDDIRKSNNIREQFKNGHSNLGLQVKSYIHSVYYLDTKNNVVIGKRECADADAFFKKHYPLINKNDILLLTQDNFNELPLLTKFNINESKSACVMPFFLKDEKKAENYILLNINEEKIFQFLKTFTVNSDAYLFITDSNGNIRSNTDKKNIFTPALYKPIIEERFLENIKREKPFFTNYFGAKRLVIFTKSKKVTLRKIYYVSAIPLAELYKHSIPLSIIALLISLLSLAFFIFLSFVIGRRIYNPINNLVSLFKPANNSDNDALKSTRSISSFSSERIKIFNDKKMTDEAEFYSYNEDFYRLPFQGKNKNLKISSIISYINENFHRDICLEGIAGEYKISTSYLSRILRDAFNIPFQQYLNNKRINKAKILLIQTNDKINDIYKECGFNSRFTFIKMFKKLAGVTPNEYRILSNNNIVKNLTAEANFP